MLYLIKDLRSSRHIQAGVVRLDMGLLDLAVLDNQSVPLAAGPAEDSGAVEGKVQSICEVKLGVGEEADAAALRGVELLGPGLCAGWVLAALLEGHGTRDSESTSGFQSIIRRNENLHKSVVHSHDEDRTGILELRRVDVSGDVALGARGREGCGHACKRKSETNGLLLCRNVSNTEGTYQ